MERGAHGWSYNEVLPVSVLLLSEMSSCAFYLHSFFTLFSHQYFIKSEDNQDPEIAYNGYHGRGGPLTVKRGKMISPLAYAFVEAGKTFGKC